MTYYIIDNVMCTFKNSFTDLIRVRRSDHQPGDLHLYRLYTAKSNIRQF
jgi:hypothetical protein